tara:strand:+ start:1471 stop:1845 length:375 start_codon:yes stop_codon:yes gene_type:complete
LNNKKPYNRVDRVGNQILDILSSILIKYIDLSNLGFITFTYVRVSPDLKNAKVFYSILDSKKTDEEINIAINQKRKAFKKYMGPQLQLKSTPDLRFYRDESILYENKINQMLLKLNISEDKDDS